MERARWSNGCSYAVEFDFDPNDSDNSLVNALVALKEFTANVGKSPIGHHQYSIIAYLHVRWGKSNWSTPLRIKTLDSGTFQGAAFSEPVYIRIIPNGYEADAALCTREWNTVFPLMCNVLRWDGALDTFVKNTGEDIQLQSDLNDWDGEIKGKTRQ